MRQIVLDTETTGLDPALGHRVIEIGALEIVNRQPTGATYHVYLNPDREIDAGAVQVHGLTNEFLADKRRFADIAHEFLEFVRDAELAKLEAGSVKRYCTVLDTLKLAKELHPGQKNNLDALCRRYEVDNSGRAFHGALLDAQLLAEVYLAMTRGQETLGIDVATPAQTEAATLVRRGVLKVLRADAAEQAAHAAYLADMARECGTAPSW